MQIRICKDQDMPGKTINFTKAESMFPLLKTCFDVQNILTLS